MLMIYLHHADRGWSPPRYVQSVEAHLPRPCIHLSTEPVVGPHGLNLEALGIILDEVLASRDDLDGYRIECSDMIHEVAA